MLNQQAGREIFVHATVNACNQLQSVAAGIQFDVTAMDDLLNFITCNVLPVQFLLTNHFLLKSCSNLFNLSSCLNNHKASESV